jgi:hypothetical protein
MRRITARSSASATGLGRQTPERATPTSAHLPETFRSAHRTGDAAVHHQPLDLFAGILTALDGPSVCQAAIRVALISFWRGVMRMKTDLARYGFRARMASSLECLSAI